MTTMQMQNHDETTQIEEHISQDDTQALVYQADYSRLLRRMNKPPDDNDDQQHRLDDLRQQY